MIAKVNRTDFVHRGRVFHMTTENVTLENDVTIDIDIIRHPGASAMVPLTRNNSVIFVRQYRHAIGDYIWEIPAGTLSPGETFRECAARELVEEIGYAPGKLDELGQVTPVPGYSDERIHIFLATELRPATQHLDIDELINIHEIDFDQAMDMAMSGEIQDCKTICGLFRTERWLQSNR